MPAAAAAAALAAAEAHLAPLLLPQHLGAGLERLERDKMARACVLRMLCVCCVCRVCVGVCKQYSAGTGGSTRPVGSMALT